MDPEETSELTSQVVPQLQVEIALREVASKLVGTEVLKVRKMLKVTKVLKVRLMLDPLDYQDLNVLKARHTSNASGPERMRKMNFLLEALLLLLKNTKSEVYFLNLVPSQTLK